MEQQNKFTFDILAPVPDLFTSSETGGLFEQCTMCHTPLLDPPTGYLIEKAFKNYPQAKKTDIIFEYAICVSCIARLSQTISDESQKKITAFMKGHIDFEKRRTDLLTEGSFDPGQWLSGCIVNNTPKDEMQEYQVMCQCFGRDAIFSYFPYLLGDSALEEIQRLLSKKTKEEMDGFYDTYLSPSPEIRELFRPKVILV